MKEVTRKLSRLFCDETLDPRPEIATDSPSKPHSLCEVVLGKEPEGEISPRAQPERDADGFVLPRKGYFPVKATFFGKGYEKETPEKRKSTPDETSTSDEAKRRKPIFSTIATSIPWKSENNKMVSPL